MDNYKDIHLVIKAKECPYWDYDSQTCIHTCGGCDDLKYGNTIKTIHCGVMIEGNRYCMLDCDVYGEVLKLLDEVEYER